MMKNKYTYLSASIFAMAFCGMSPALAQTAQDSTTNVAFGIIEKRDLLGAISSVTVSELLKKNYSQSSLDGLQTFVGGYNGNIWGQSALVLVDGFPRDASSVRASEVESVTILKGANAVALYGSKAAKGVVLITTKRGEEGPLRIDVRANTGLFVPKAYPKFLNAADYMTLYNEASRNDGIAEKYSQSQIYNTYTGKNPYRYPDIDFYSSDYLRKVYNRTDVTGEIHGGNRRTHYYTNFGISYNNDLMKYGEAKNNSDMRFNVRANVDMSITNWLSASADAAAIYTNSYHGRGSQDNNYWSAASTLRPNWYSPLVPLDMMDPNNSSIQNMVHNSSHLIDGKYVFGGTSTDTTNPFSDMLAGSYIKDKSRSFMFNVGVKADLSSLLEGLSFKTAYAVDYTAGFSEAFKFDYAVYEPVWSNMNGKDMITGLNKYNEDKASTSEYVGNSIYSQTMTFSAQFDYLRTFGKFHNVSATVLGWGYQTQKSADANHNSSDYHRNSNVNLGIQATYNYKHRYYLDFTGAVVHSAKLPEGNRDAFSPTVTAGWRISDESFFKDHIAWVDNLKLTASYGKLNQDIDISDYYMYKGYFVDNGGWYQWQDNSAGGYTTASKRGDNPNLTFIQREEFRAGLEASLWKGMVTLDANYFLQYTNGGLVQGTNTIYPSYYSNWDFSFLPYLNYEKDKRTGIDFSLNLKKKIGQVEANLGFSGMYIATEAIRRDEVYQDAYQYRVGKPLDSYWGYICEGFFQDEADIEGHATQSFGTTKPGDLKYKDVNQDGVVDSKDQVNLGHNGWSVAPFSFGINLTLKWKDFTLFAMGTGSTGAIGFKNSSYYWVRGSSKYSEVVWGRWTEQTKNTATYPRLTTTNNSNNFQNSTFWMYKTNRFDLNRVQLTYDLPNKIFKPSSFVRGLSVYVLGESLLTLSKERKLMETNVGSAPQCRFYNIGFKAFF